MSFGVGNQLTSVVAVGGGGGSLYSGCKRQHGVWQGSTHEGLLLKLLGNVCWTGGPLELRAWASGAEVVSFAVLQAEHFVFKVVFLLDRSAFHRRLGVFLGGRKSSQGSGGCWMSHSLAGSLRDADRLVGLGSSQLMSSVFAAARLFFVLFFIGHR